MVLIVCIDENGGMAFGNKRQSMDRVVREKILEISNPHTLFMSNYSKKQFEDNPRICVEDNLFAVAKKDAYCFAELENLANLEEKFDKIIVYNWNRRYPYDLKFNINLDTWRLVSRKDFKGFSHEKITEEVYEK